MDPIHKHDTFDCETLDKVQIKLSSPGTKQINEKYFDEEYEQRGNSENFNTINIEVASPEENEHVDPLEMENLIPKNETLDCKTIDKVQIKVSVYGSRSLCQTHDFNPLCRKRTTSDNFFEYFFGGTDLLFKIEKVENLSEILLILLSNHNTP